LNVTCGARGILPKIPHISRVPSGSVRRACPDPHHPPTSTVSLEEGPSPAFVARGLGGLMVDQWAPRRFLSPRTTVRISIPSFPHPPVSPPFLRSGGGVRGADVPRAPRGDRLLHPGPPLRRRGGGVGPSSPGPYLTPRPHHVGGPLGPGGTRRSCRTCGSTSPPGARRPPRTSATAPPTSSSPRTTPNGVLCPPTVRTATVWSEFLDAPKFLNPEYSVSEEFMDSTKPR